MSTPVTIFHLQMLSRDELRRPRAVPDDAEIRRAELPSPVLSRYLYTAIGGDWHWRDRLAWSYQRWMQYLDRPEVQTWVLYMRGTPAGYIELNREGGDVEIAYFGLMPEFLGRKLGGHLLAEGIGRAWEMGARRVWVHTCTLDGPHARANYEARGMRLFKTESMIVPDVGAPDGPWPNAGPR